MSESLRVLIVEDEFLIAMELENLLQDEGCDVIGVARSYDEAVEIGDRLLPDLALVDIHLADGPNGVRAARHLSQQADVTVLFTTANAKRIPEDFAGAFGVIGKPYSERGIRQALDYVRQVRNGRDVPPPDSLKLSPLKSARQIAPRPLDAMAPQHGTDEAGSTLRG